MTITQDDYVELLTMMIDAEKELDEHRATIKSLNESLEFIRETLSADYVLRAKYDLELEVTREHVHSLAQRLAEVSGLSVSEVMRESLIGNRMARIEQDYRRIETILSDTADLMGEVVLEAKHGKNPFRPDQPSALERLEAKRDAVTKLMSRKT